MKPVVVKRDKFVMIPADVLWQLVEPAETLSAWLPICDRCEVLQGTGRGRIQRMHLRWGRRDAQIDAEVIDYRPEHRLSWRHVAEWIDGKPAPQISSEVTSTVELVPEGSGTRVVLTSRNVPSAWWAVPLLKVLAARRINKAYGVALSRLAGANKDL